uniref:Copia protein n=1 Tax=Tanacetum cinerariifolium TaxID=118510 RepID=A0A6L2KVU3_TANCI|nr:copia protein [Tanacetum cinerariifolium]
MVTLTAEDMQRKKNDVKERTTLLLSLPNEHQLRFSKYKTTRELWAAILKTFRGNEATKKTKKNLLKQQYGNFEAEGSETLEQTFNRLQVIIGQLQFMDVEIEKDDLNQKFLTSLAPEWLMHTIVWRNKSDLDTMSLDNLYNNLKVYESEVQKKLEPNSQNMTFISSTKHSSGNDDGNTVCVPTACTNVPTASASVATISQDTACAYIASQSSDKFWKKTGKKISIQGSDLVGFDKSKVKCFNCHKMGHFARECRAPKSQDRRRRDNYRQGSKAEEQAPKALMAIDGVGWDWSYMANDKEDHALVADEIAPTEFALMANTSAEKSRLVEYKEREVKYIEKIKTLEFYNESNKECIETLKKKLETLKQEKEGVDGKLAGLLTASKDLDNLIESQRSDKNKEGLGYTVVPPPPAQLYLSPKKDLSWTGLIECADDTVTDYSRPSPTVESTLEDGQNRNPSVSENVASPITPKPFIKFVKPKDCQSESKTDKKETPKKPPVKYAEQYRKPKKKPNAHSYANRPVRRTSALRSPYRAPWVPTVNRNYPPVNRKFSTGSRKFPTTNRKFLTASRKFPTGSTKGSTADMGRKGKAVKPSACLFWRPSQNLSNKVPKNNKCIVLGKDFKLLDDANILLRTPRQHNIYSIDLNNIVPHRNLTCLVVKASADECMLWHRRLGHLNFKTMNELVRHNLVRGLPTKCFANDYTCTSCLKGKQHKASYETSGILKKFITEIENLKDLKVKIISKPQDHCSTEGPEGSGNPNPTASISNPPADQMETLTVETPIPTFEGILGVTSNSDESNGMEANISNMETAITASPTLTIRIHKDHPKSQIIVKPKKISNALQDPSWVEAMQEELLQFKMQNVWTLVDCPIGVRPIGTKWVLKNKKDKRGIVIRNKARLVAQGHTQEEGINYDEVFSLFRIEAIRLFLAYASFMGFTVYQMDVKSAFLYGTIDEEVYLCREFEALMHEKFQMSAMDELNFFLGLQVLQKEDGIFLSQENYVGDKEYPLRKGLTIVMISYKLQVKNYSQMANDLILKIYKIASSPRQQDD